VFEDEQDTTLRSTILAVLTAIMIVCPTIWTIFNFVANHSRPGRKKPQFRQWSAQDLHGENVLTLYFLHSLSQVDQGEELMMVVESLKRYLKAQEIEEIQKAIESLDARKQFSLLGIVLGTEKSANLSPGQALDKMLEEFMLNVENILPPGCFVPLSRELVNMLESKRPINTQQATAISD
jgi:hypothetical protein